MVFLFPLVEVEKSRKGYILEQEIAFGGCFEEICQRCWLDHHVPSNWTQLIKGRDCFKIDCVIIFVSSFQSSFDSTNLLLMTVSIPRRGREGEEKRGKEEH